MNKSSLDQKKFAVIGFRGAGKTTYIKALGGAVKGKGSEYEIVDGEKYMQSLAENFYFKYCVFRSVLGLFWV